MTSYSAFLKTPVNFRSRLRRSQYTTFNLVSNVVKKRANCRLCLPRAEKWSIFKGVSGFAPLWKFFCGCPCIRVNMQRTWRAPKARVEIFQSPHFLGRSYASVIQFIDSCVTSKTMNINMDLLVYCLQNK